MATLTSITNLLVLENYLRDLGQFVARDLLRLTNDKFLWFENTLLEKVISYIQKCKNDWSMLSEEERREAKKFISENYKALKKLYDSYSRAYAVRNRSVYLDKEYIDESLLTELVQLLKNIIFSCPRYKAFVLEDTGEILYNSNYDPNWKDYIQFRERTEEEYQREFYDPEMEDIVYFRGLKSFDSCFLRIARFIFQCYIEDEFISTFLGLEKDGTSVSNNLREFTMGHRFRCFCNGDRNIAGILEGCIFSNFSAYFEKSTFKSKGIPMTASFFQDVKDGIFSVLGEELHNSLLERRELDITPRVGFDLVETMEFFHGAKLTDEIVEQVASMTGVFINKDLFNKTLDKMKDINYPMSKETYDSVKNFMPKHFKYDEDKEVLHAPWLSYSPQVAGRMTQKQIQGLKSETKALMFNNSNYCNIDLQACHISLRVPHLRKMLSDVKTEINSRKCLFFWTPRGKMLDYDNYSDAQLYSMQSELKSAFYKLKDIADKSKEIRAVWSVGLRISKKDTKDLINAISNGASLQNKEVQRITSAPDFNWSFFYSVVNDELLIPCKVFNKYVKDYVKNILSPCVKSKVQGLEKYKFDNSVVSMGSVSYDSDYFDKLPSYKATSYLLMATEAYLVLSTMQDISRRKKYTRGISVASYEYDGVLLVKDSSCTLTDDYLANYVTDRINEHARRLLHMQKRTYGDICIKAVKKSFKE